MKIDIDPQELEFLVQLLSRQTNESGSFHLFGKLRQQALAAAKGETDVEVEEEPPKEAQG